MLVGLVVHRVEHQRDHTRTIHKNGDGRVRTLRLQLLEQIDQPLGLRGTGGTLLLCLYVCEAPLCCEGKFWRQAVRELLARRPFEFEFEFEFKFKR